MRRPAIILSLAAALLSACATYPTPNPQQQRLQSMPQRYNQFDVVMGWEVKPSDGGTVVQGIVKNVRYYMMRGLEIWVVPLDSAGKEITRGVTYIIPSDLPLDHSADFTVKLPVTVTAGERLRFTYKYSGNDGGDADKGGGIDWMQSFVTVVPAR
ncbi:hypothetical protein E4633_18740 [Geomonas terrae]|uniref:Lipoprotein n=1 Tax=Geomonas terrae TaxID=2562681 RepID=A0A4S1CAB8_9BACT|nr:FxLYD domain-containing protein [Geomonas terrae]TGU70238.1 hypothetical protein E4633_18740 [Geomonas terrae]